MKKKILFVICFISIISFLTPITQGLENTNEINDITTISSNRLTYFFIGRITNLTENDPIYGTTSFQPIRVRFFIRVLQDGGKMVYVGRAIHYQNKIYLPPNPDRVIGIIRENYICALFLYNNL
jgi:hypothetical protein